NPSAQASAESPPAPAPSAPAPSASAPRPASAPKPAATSKPTPTPLPTPAAAPAAAPAPASTAQKQLVDQAQRSALEAPAAVDKAKEAADAARTMAGEARIVEARAARSGLENATRLTSDDGASYVGQASAGQRQGLGVAESKDGDRQAGEWKDNMLSG